MKRRYADSPSAWERVWKLHKWQKMTFLCRRSQKRSSHYNVVSLVLMGAMVSLVKKQWVETRTVAIGEPQEKRNADGETEIHVGQLSYFSRLADAFTFSNLAEVEMQRRNVAQASLACAVLDGALLSAILYRQASARRAAYLDFPTCQ